MPYQISKQGDKWITKNKATGEIKGHHDSYIKALKQMRLLQGVEHGWKPTGAPSKLKKGWRPPVEA